MSESVNTEAFDETYDIVVIGAGAGGLSAAVQAAHNGNSIAVLEKMDMIGGSSALAEGHAAFESSEQEKRGIVVTKDEAVKSYIEYSHWRANPEVVRAFVDNAATTVEKLRAEGIEYVDVTVTAVDQPDEKRTWHLPEGEIAKVCETLAANARKLGADIFLGTAATRLVMEDGHVAGVIASDSDGNIVRLGCRAVIVASGGFAANPEMMAKYSRFDHAEEIINVGGAGNTGDGINMALEAGADTFGLGLLMLVPVVRGKTITSHVNTAGSQPYLWVNSTGRRFVNEIVGLNFADAGNVLASQPGGFAFTVIDQDSIAHLEKDGCEIGLGLFVLTGTKLTRLREEIETDVVAGEIAFKSDTIEGLAEEMGVDPATFAGTVAEYNEACRTGRDGGMRKAKYLFPVEKGPFYAIKMEVGILVSIGGIKVDGDLRVIGKDGEPIGGLYAVGVDAGGMFGDAYTLNIPGTSCGFALTGGWLAADHASQVIKESAAHAAQAV
jgi:fumarate reductase flavoprotein subunit